MLGSLTPTCLSYRLLLIISQGIDFMIRDYHSGFEYLVDIKFPDLLHGKVLRSPHPHALIKSIDKKKAEALEGVKAVLTWEDIPEWKSGIPPVFPLLSQKVRYVGDAVALVAAETKELSENALGLIHEEFNVLTAVFNVE